jgi:endoglucanase
LSDRSRTDVAVVGAGPAGSAVATFLAQDGHDVLLIDKEQFPREKVCGDGLTPRAVKALQTLGLHAEAEGDAAGWARQSQLRMYGGGVTLDLPWPELDDWPAHSLTATRALFDHTLAHHAVKAGAQLWERTDVTGPVFLDSHGGRVAGVTYRRADGSTGVVRSRVVVAADGSELYPADAAVNHWVNANPGDHRAPLIADRIASRPQAVWFAGQYNPGTITAQVREITSAASQAGQVPVLVPYMIPFRDCGNHSGGGAPDFAGYQTWAQNFAAGLGSDPVVVIMEPDAIPLIGCLDERQRADRLAGIRGAAAAIMAANPEARIYYDSGHSAWHHPSSIAGPLREAGILEYGAGVATNVSNYRVTADETAFAHALVGELGGGLGAVIDTSRNGNGPLGSEWCDPPGRLVGQAPTTSTGDPVVDAYLWIKLPGELDGCDGPAGSFSPAKAYELAGGR